MSVDYRPNYDPADVDSDYGHTGGDITVPTFTANMKPFRFWCQKALPLVYDDSLSYYEVLCKVVKQMNDFLTDLQTATGAIDEFAQQFVINQQFLNEMADQLGQNIEDLETYINERMTDFMTAYTQLQDYVNNYFDNLDVQQEINNKLDEMASDGTFNDLFDPVITAWMTTKTAQIDASIAAQNAVQAEQNGRISTLESRMDTFASLPSGSTSGNAELLDIRTNFLGETYPTAGDAVRASDMIASGFQSISATKLEEWDGNDESSVYDSIQIDISGYKGGHVVVIGSFKYFQSDLNNTGSCAVYATNTPGEVGDANAVNYLPGTSNSIFTNFTQITTSISGEERLLLQFAIPDDFSYQYLKIGHFEHNPVSGNYTEPLYIVYANSWSKTQVDPTLSITGDAADAKATGDALDELNERSLQVKATIESGDLNNYLDSGIYEHVAGTEVANAPADGGRIIISKIGTATTQVYYANRRSTGNYGKVFFRTIIGSTVNDWVILSGTSGTIESGDLNNYLSNGIYAHVAGTTVANAPSDGGLLCVYKIGASTTQIYYANRSSTGNYGKLFFRTIISNTIYDWVRLDGNSPDYIKTIGTIESGDLNTYLSNGVYGHITGTTVANAPSDGGLLCVYKIGATTAQLYYANRSSTGNYGKIYFRSIIGSTVYDWVRVDVNSPDNIKTIGTIESGDLNNYLNNGIYAHVDGTTVANAPADGGRLVVSKISIGTVQLYYADRKSSKNYGKVFFRTIIGSTINEWIRIDGSRDNAIKIAFFGDSGIWSAIKTVNQSQTGFITTQANPTVTDTISKVLGYPVTNYGVGGIGYLKKAGDPERNIYELVQNTDLTGYTHAFFMAGDNDSYVGSSGIGTYTDTTQDTIMGQIYRIMTYLHDNYPNLVPVIVDKNNKISIKNPDGTTATSFGSFPSYYYGFTYTNGYRIMDLFEETEKFCNYYNVGHIRYNDTGLSSWVIQSMPGPDGTHFSQEGYNMYGRDLAGRMARFI